MRALRPKTSLLYDAAHEFKIGGSCIIRQTADDILTIVASGITVFEALKAAEELKKEGINVRVLDCYSVNPVDKEMLIKCLQETKKQILITVEDHFAHGGLGDFVAAAVSEMNIHLEKMAVLSISRSGSKEQLLNQAGIDASAIITKIKELIK